MSATWVVVVPRGPGGIQWQQLWAAASILKSAVSRTRVILVSDRSVAPSVGLRAIPWHRERVKWVVEDVILDPISVHQAVFHQARFGHYVVSPVPLELDEAEVEVLTTGTIEEPGNFNRWHPVPLRGQLAVELSVEDELSRWLRLPMAKQVTLKGEGLPGCLPEVLAHREINFLHPPPNSRNRS